MSRFDPHAYLDAAAQALELPIPAQYRDGVAANLARLQAMATELMHFPVPAAEEPGGEPRDSARE